MNLKIHCDYRKQKISIASDAQYIHVVLMILDIFNRPKRNRYLFLSLLGLLILSFIAVGKEYNFYICFEPVIVLVIILLACCLCRQGPPFFELTSYCIYTIHLIFNEVNEIMKQSFPEILTIKQATEYMRSVAGHYMYCEATLRRFAHQGTLRCKQVDKKHKMFLFKSDLKLKLLDPYLSQGA